MAHKQTVRVRQACAAIIVDSNVLIKDMVDADAIEDYQSYSTFKPGQLLNGIDSLTELLRWEVQR